MNDNEIIKAWEWHTEPINDGRMKIRPVIVECTGELADSTLNMLKGQKAEIEKLQNELKTTRNYIHENNLEYDLLAYSKRGSE